LRAIPWNKSETNTVDIIIKFKLFNPFEGQDILLYTLSGTFKLIRQVGNPNIPQNVAYEANN